MTDDGGPRRRIVAAAARLLESGGEDGQSREVVTAHDGWLNSVAV